MNKYNGLTTNFNPEFRSSFQALRAAVSEVPSTLNGTDQMLADLALKQRTLLSLLDDRC
jgi:hypothetical protein